MEYLKILRILKATAKTISKEISYVAFLLVATNHLRYGGDKNAE